MERRFTTWTVNPKFGLRNNFLTPQTPNIIFNEIKDQLDSPKFLRLGGFFSFGVCALPEGVMWPEDVPKNDPSLNSYMQVAGVHEAMTVEVRVSDDGDSYSVYSDAKDVVAVRTALQEAGIEYDSAEVQFVPSMKVEVDAEGARKALKVIDALEDCDDVQNVFSNLDIPEAVMAELEAEG